MRHYARNATRGTIIVASVFIALCVVAALPPLSAGRPAGVSVLITNNSARGIRHVFFSPVNNNNWSGNQLSRGIAPGQSARVSAANCPGSSVRVIAEDIDGCFVSVVVACGSTAEWAITNSTLRDCGN